MIIVFYNIMLDIGERAFELMFLVVMQASAQMRAGAFKGALYRIQILCRRYTFWSYPAGLIIADPPG